MTTLPPVGIPYWVAHFGSSALDLPTSYFNAKVKTCLGSEPNNTIGMKCAIPSCNAPAEGKFPCCTKHETESRILASLPPSELIKIDLKIRSIFHDQQEIK